MTSNSQPRKYVVCVRGVTGFGVVMIDVLFGPPAALSTHGLSPCESVWFVPSGVVRPGLFFSQFLPRSGFLLLFHALPPVRHHKRGQQASINALAGQIRVCC